MSKNDFDRALDDFLSAKNDKEEEDREASSHLSTQGKSYSQEDKMFLAYVK
jgi:hypothetical protein